MATTPRVTYLANGAVSDFDVPFPYLNPEHIFAFVEAGAATFTWLTESRVRIAPTPPAGASVRIMRVTPTTPLFTIPDNNPVPSYWYNQLTKQAIYVAEEQSGSAAEYAEISKRLLDALQALAQDVASFTTGFSSVASAAAATVAPQIRELRMAGFSSAGDGGSATYSRSTLEPVGAGGKFQSADGAWWKLSSSPVTPAMFGVRCDNTDETDGVTLLLNFASRNRVPIQWPAGGKVAFSSFDDAQAAPYHVWRGGPMTMRSTKTSPIATSYESDWFIRIAANTRRIDSVASSIFEGGARVTLGSATDIVPGDFLLFLSSRMIETDHRGQARHGFGVPALRAIDATTVELARTIPATALVGNVSGTVTAKPAANVLTVAGLSGLSTSDARYRIRFNSGAASGSTAYVVGFDPATNRITSHASNGAFPAGVAVGDAFTIERDISVLVSYAAHVDIDMPLTLERAPHLTATAGAFGFRGLYIERAVKPRVIGLRTRNFSEGGIRINWGYEAVFADQTHEGCNRSYDGSDGTGYGVTVFQTSWSRFSRIQGMGCRRVLDVSGTQGVSYYNLVEDIEGHGAGTTYTGSRFWPAGTEFQTVAGSHGAAWGTTYQNIRGVSTWGVVNTRGDGESVRGVYGTGQMQVLLNAFLGDGLDADGLYYRSNGFDWGLARNVRLQPAPVTSKLQDVVRIAAYNVLPNRMHNIRNIDAQGVVRSVVSIEGPGSVGPIVLHGSVVTDNEDGTNSVFSVLRNTGGTAITLNGPVIANVSILNNPAAPKTYPSLLAVADFTVASGFWWKMPNGNTMVYLADDAAVALPASRSFAVSKVDVTSWATGRSWHMLGGLAWTGQAGNRATVANANLVDIAATALAGTTGTDGRVTVAVNPGSTSEVHLENRSGVADWIILRCDALVA